MRWSSATGRAGGMRRSTIGSVFVVLCLITTNVASQPPAIGDDDVAVHADALAAVAEGRAAILMRHALAPGTGDPVDFTLDDCRTQRNLSDEGRAQAERIGARLRAYLGSDVIVRTSAWCRCRDTADILALGSVSVLPVLNSFFRERGSAAVQTESLREWLLDHWGRPDAGAAVLVTHQVNVTALTGIFPGSGEIVVVAPAGSGEAAVPSNVDGIEVLARIED